MYPQPISELCSYILEYGITRLLKRGDAGDVIGGEEASACNKATS